MVGVTAAGVPDAVGEAITEWLDDHEPVSRAAFDQIDSAFMRTVGKPARHPNYGINKHLRLADPVALGLFAHEHDLALAELDESGKWGDVMGVAHDDGWVPVLICMAGDVVTVADRMHRLYHALDDITPCQQCVIPDGGTVDDAELRERVERYVDTHPDADRSAVIEQLGLDSDEQAVVDEVLNAGETTADKHDSTITNNYLPAADAQQTTGTAAPVDEQCCLPQCHEPARHDHQDSLCERHQPGTSRTSAPPPEPDLELFADDQDSVSVDAGAFMHSGGMPDRSPNRSREGPRATGGPSLTKPTSALPLGQLDALPLRARRRAARERGRDWPTTDEAREQLRETLYQALRHEDDAVIDAPTALGKSYTVATTRWGARPDLTGGQPVVHLLPTRDARDEAATWAAEDGGDHFVLQARHEACPVAAGEHDPVDDPDDDDSPDVVITIDGEPASDWLARMCNDRQIPFSAAHRHLEQHNDQGLDELPCCEAGEYAGICDAFGQWEEYRNDDYPLVIGTHNFAHVPGLRLHTNMVIDEQVDFATDLTTDRVRRAVGAYLRAVDAPVSTWEAFITLVRGQDDLEAIADEARRNGLVPSEYRDQRLEDLEAALDCEPDREWYFECEAAHTLAPALARAIIHAETRANGRRVGKTVYEPPRLDANARDAAEWNRILVTVVLDEANEVRTVRVVPDLSLCRSVVGLDAFPSRPVWQVNTLPWLQRQRVLEPEERRQWRRYERGLRVVQVGEATRPLASGEYFDHKGVRALCEHLRDEYGERFRTAITAKSVADRLERIMDRVGVSYPALMHFGAEKSRNDFAAESIGLVEGCIDPGDDYVLDLLAELDCDADPERSDVPCDECGGDGCHACTGTGHKRAHGRGFVGPDADTARAILASVRESHTAQAAGRYARNPDDPDSHATVFVRTDALPVGFADVQVPGVEWVFADKQQGIVEVLRDADQPLSAQTIATRADCSREHVRQTLERLRREDHDQEAAVQRFEHAGDYGATLYAATGLPNAGVVNLAHDLDGAPTTTYRGSYTWALAIHDPDEREDAGDTPATAARRSTGRPDEGFDPPDPGG